MERLNKYIFEDVRVYIAHLNETVMQTRDAHNLNTKNTEMIGRTEVLAACLAGMQKEENASVAVNVKYPILGIEYCAIGEKDGRIRGYAEKIEAPKKKGVVLEVTQKLPIKGDYTGVVAAVTLNSAVKSYFKQSLQVPTKSCIYYNDKGFYCVIAEQLPGGGDVSRVWELTRRLFTNDFNFDAFKRINNYNLVEELELKFGCTCSKSAVFGMIDAMSEDEKKNISHDGYITMDCKFCGKEYKFEI